MHLSWSLWIQKELYFPGNKSVSLTHIKVSIVLLIGGHYVWCKMALFYITFSAWNVSFPYISAAIPPTSLIHITKKYELLDLWLFILQISLVILEHFNCRILCSSIFCIHVSYFCVGDLNHLQRFWKLIAGKNACYYISVWSFVDMCKKDSKIQTACNLSILCCTMQCN